MKNTYVPYYFWVKRFIRELANFFVIFKLENVILLKIMILYFYQYF